MSKIKFLDRRGVIIVWLALFMLPLLIMFSGLAIDIAYMYHVKNQLQVAADAAALAGAAKLDGTNSIVQTNARNEAVNFAGKNSAAGSSVVVASDGGNGLTSTNDITVGTFNVSTGYTLGPPPGTIPVNAVEVRTRRTGGSPGGPVSTFWGKIFNAFPSIGSNWSLMSATASAIATKPLRASEFISVCLNSCTNEATGASCTYPNDPCPVSRVITSSSSGGNCACGGDVSGCNVKLAWTSLTQSPTSGSGVATLLCGNAPYQEVCGTSIFTTMGNVSSTWQDFESLMFDPLFDSGSKTCADGACDSSSDAVTSWLLTIPITTDCPPGCNSTVPVFGYAKIRVTAICAPGSGTPCHSLSSAARAASNAACASYSNDTVVIDQIQCISCADAGDVTGLKPVLVK